MTDSDKICVCGCKKWTHYGLEGKCTSDAGAFWQCECKGFVEDEEGKEVVR